MSFGSSKPCPYTAAGTICSFQIFMTSTMEHGHGVEIMILCGPGAATEGPTTYGSGDIIPASGADAFTIVYDITHTNRYIST